MGMTNGCHGNHMCDASLILITYSDIIFLLKRNMFKP